MRILFVVLLLVAGCVGPEDAADPGPELPAEQDAEVPDDGADDAVDDTGGEERRTTMLSYAGVARNDCDIMTGNGHAHAGCPNAGSDPKYKTMDIRIPDNTTQLLLEWRSDGGRMAATVGHPEGSAHAEYYDANFEGYHKWSTTRDAFAGSDLNIGIQAWNEGTEEAPAGTLENGVADVAITFFINGTAADPGVFCRLC